MDDLLTREVLIDHLQVLEQAASDEQYTMDREEAQAMRLWLEDHDAALRTRAEAAEAEARLVRDALVTAERKLLDLGIAWVWFPWHDLIPATAAAAERVKAMERFWKATCERNRATGVPGTSDEEIERACIEYEEAYEALLVSAKAREWLEAQSEEEAE